MGGPSGHRTVENADDWMRQHEKKILHEERRPRITKASDLLGPGLGAHAVEVNDWSGEESEFNGFLYSRPGALNAPDSTAWWMGYTITQVEGFGIQTAWDYRGVTLPIPTKSRRFALVGGVRVFAAWA